MLIAFDGACLCDGPPTGVARAFLTALSAYAALGVADCVLLLPPGAPDPELAGVRAVPAPRGALRRQLGLPGLLRSLRVRVLHSPVASVPLRAPCPTIATVHDLPWAHPEAGERCRLRRRLATLLALRAATVVLAPSQFTAGDVQAWGLARQPQVRVVPHGTVRGPQPDAPSSARRSGPFLVLGDDRPRKNHPRVRAAHARARAACAGLPELDFVGPPQRFVDEAEKARLLQRCRAVVHLSRFEGFGLPVLEGLAHGAPVLCSDLPPHREIAGPHALFAPADDIAAMAAAMVLVHEDQTLRARLAHDGWQHAAQFAPEHVAARWRALHEELQ